MKTDIHPKLNVIQVTCACGSVFETLSVRDAVRVEICSACHPFFTGKKRVVDTAGRVERFMNRAATAGNKYGQRVKPKK